MKKEEMTDREERIVFPGKVNLPFSYSAGRTASRFFVELRDNEKIMGKRCPQCRRVIVPAQLFCREGFVETDEWVEVSPQGTLISFTVVYRKEPHHPTDTPFAYGIIQLDGADTSMVHILGEVDPADIKHGMRLCAIFKENRVGNILDISHFKPEDDGISS